MLLVTFHGGSSGVNNIYAYLTGSGPQTQPLSTSVLTTTATLSELRGMAASSCLLYVANGSKHTSNILCFQGSGLSYTLQSVFIDGQVNSVNHPFSLTFDSSGNCYVSNQDTNVVAWFAAGQPNPVASYWSTVKQKTKGTFLDATFVASKEGDLPNVPTAPTLEKGEGGLDVNIEKGKMQNSVRDVLFAAGILFVVDEPGNCVRMYEPGTGNYLGKSSGALDSPTHLLLDPTGATLYVSAGKQIWSAALPTSTTKPALAFTSVFTTTLGNISGLAFDGSNSYIAIRTGTPQILIADETFQNPNAFVASLPDSPEFLLFLPNPAK